MTSERRRQHPGSDPLRLSPSERSEAGYRLYAEADVRRLYRTVALRRLDFPLEEIAALLNAGEPDLAETARRHLERVRARPRVTEAASKATRTDVRVFVEQSEPRLLVAEESFAGSVELSPWGG